MTSIMIVTWRTNERGAMLSTEVRELAVPDIILKRRVAQKEKLCKIDSILKW